MNITQRLEAAKHELEQRLKTNLSTLAVNGGWGLYESDREAILLNTLRLIAGPMPKKELVQWISGMNTGLMWEVPSE